ncbi:MAG: tRNA (adenosine(37)-N6)-dimethylallyltransferase MiaA [Chloroflexi bacterium]|nr:tRNA (adenosine(37)-N6)-dimethylallyltransferase MiaA [Chloroflexota bacterium]
MNRLISIVGPTGVGKSRLALTLAQTFNGEVVGGDSRQVYRAMDIGTDKPTQEELSLVPHHLLDIVNPDDPFSLAQYQGLAYQAIEDINRRQKLPILAGGTGQYVWAVLEGWCIPRIPPDLKLRASLEKQAADEGTEQLYRELLKANPETAGKIDPRNVRRLIRAVEITRRTKSKISGLKKTEPSFRRLIIGLTADRPELYRRIDARVDEMIKRGLVAEVEKLLKMGYDFTLPAMSGIGYRQIGSYLRNEITLETAVTKIKNETHRFARQQYNWFRLEDERINWFDVAGQPESAIVKLVSRFVTGNTISEGTFTPDIPGNDNFETGR